MFCECVCAYLVCFLIEGARTCVCAYLVCFLTEGARTKLCVRVRVCVCVCVFYVGGPERFFLGFLNFVFVLGRF